MQTRDQHKSALWRTARAGRITASNIHLVVSTPLSSPALSTVKKVCYPHKASYTGNRKQDDEQLTPMEWGRAEEDTARESYTRKQELQHEGLKVEKCGFIMNSSFPELGASPDALVDCVCCGKGCVEIKCPHKHCDHIIFQACADEDFCLEVTNDKLQLKNTHVYYKQVQTQVFVTGAQFVWTKKSCEIVRVTPDVELWETTLLPKAQSFFYMVVLPELVACHYTQQASTPVLQPLAESQPVHAHQRNKQARKNAVELWCFCRKPEHRVMIACDIKENCATQWYHLGCVGMGQAPAEDESWYCPACVLLE